MEINKITKLFVTISIFVIPFVFLGCSQEKTIKKSKPRVALSTFVLYDIANHIAQDKVELVRIIPAGVGIHSFEPTPQTIANIETSDLVLYNGAGLEPWLDSFTFKNRAVGVGNYIRLQHLAEIEHVHDDHGACSHSQFDPHIWFDIDSMKQITQIIAYELIALDPKNKTSYLDNRDRYIDMLNRLDLLYKNKLQSCSLNTIITNHNAFSYLSSKYGFKIKTLSGLSPEAEVSPKDVIRIMKDIQTNNIDVVFFEDFGSDKAMKSLAKQVSVKVDSLHPLGNITKDDIEKKYTYEDIMLKNLEKISGALHCQ